MDDKNLIFIKYLENIHDNTGMYKLMTQIDLGINCRIFLNLFQNFEYKNLNGHHLSNLSPHG